MYYHFPPLNYFAIFLMKVEVADSISLYPISILSMSMDLYS